MRNSYTSNFNYLTSFLRMWVLALFLAMPASGAFMVKPMIVEMQPRPGKRVLNVLQIVNESPDETAIIDFTICEVSQNEDGSWLIIEPNTVEADKFAADPNSADISSCRSWIKLAKSQMQIPPMGIQPLLLTLQVPPRIRGFYSAGIIATEALRPDATGVAIRMRYLIPIMVEIQGSTAAHKVELTDVDMVAKPADLEGPSTTLVSMKISNSGSSRAKLEPFIRVQSYVDGHWWLITEDTVDPLSIFPKINLNLKKDIHRPLPSGTYKVTGMVLVDGRQVPALGRTLKFEGDPSATRAARDMRLKLEPEDIIVETIPGGRRTATIRINNPSNDPVTINASIVIPTVLKNSPPDLKGTELNCSDWLTLNRDQIKIDGHRNQSIGITAVLPRVDDPAMLHATYYAQLNLQATYEDGYNAGLTTANICVVNKKVKGVTKAVCMQLSPRRINETDYHVAASFLNNGTTHFTPKCYATLSEANGNIVQRKLLQGESSKVMLPTEGRTFSAIFGLGSLSPGFYRLSATLEYGDGTPNETRTIPVQVEQNGDQVSVKMVTQTEFEKQSGAKW